jgi:ornithine cyclodeaminase/alanine dehydrogenase-like protein (mu-crystallin family)
MDPHKACGPIGALVLSRGDVADLLHPTSCRVAVEEAFRHHGQGLAVLPGVLGYRARGGGFHVKVGQSRAGRGPFVVVKTNSNFPGNPARGLPTVQGLIQVFDLETGVLIAVMDSIEITILRTAAATAVAARYLARKKASVMTVIGCGVQGRAHVRALREVRPIRRVQLWDVQRSACARLAAELGGEAGPEFTILDDVADGVRHSDIVVTCTPSTRQILQADSVAPGSFVAGVGADAEDKHELDPALLARSKVVVDMLDQCVSIGDLHHALAAGVMRREDVHAEIGQIVAGRRPGRTAESETFVFDSTGMALQDAAACAVVIDRARQESRGFYLDFSTTNSFTSGGSNEVDHTSAAENRSHRVPLAD